MSPAWCLFCKSLEGEGPGRPWPAAARPRGLERPHQCCASKDAARCLTAQQRRALCRYDYDHGEDGLTPDAPSWYCQLFKKELEAGADVDFLAGGPSPSSSGGGSDSDQGDE